MWLEWLRKKKPEVPDIRTHGLAIFWYDHGCPKEIGDKIEVDMRSGKKAEFELYMIDRAWGTDWNWYTLKFNHYL